MCDCSVDSKVPGKFYMAGTDGTGEYTVVAMSPLGRVGYRTLNSGDTRVRVEPVDETVVEQLASRFNDSWKVPEEGKLRFSTVIYGQEELGCALSTAIRALGITMPEGVEVNDDAPDWAKALVACPLPVATEVLVERPESDDDGVSTEEVAADAS